MKRIIGLVCLAILAPMSYGQPSGDPGAGAPYEAGRFDGGKMWTFEYPPLQYLRETYDFHPDEAWFEEARLGALRIPGCTASFVSPHGLIMTNHHCARSSITQVTRPGERLLEEGFYAQALVEERPVAGFFADQLVAIADVTAEVMDAAKAGQTNAERAALLQATIEQIQGRLTDAAGGADAGMRVEVVSLYNGGRYSAYTFRRYTDLRLAFAPELQIGYFGGDEDNFTYPRFNLDVAFFRIYGAEGGPLPADHYFAWSEGGASEGEPVFVVGNPGSTFRLETVAQLDYRRDVQEQVVLDFLISRARVLEAFVTAHPDATGAEAASNLAASLRNSQKVYEGRLRALHDPEVMGRKGDAEQAFQAAVEQEDALREAYGSLIAQMAEVQQEKRALREASGAFFQLTNPTFASSTLVRALWAYQYLEAQRDGAEEAALADYRARLVAVPDQEGDLDRQLLTAQLADIGRYFSEGSPLPSEPAAAQRAQALLAASSLSSQAAAEAALSAGTLSAEDPAVQVAAALFPPFQQYQQENAALGARQQELAAQLGSARFAVYGTALPPDATFSLRFADGVVKGYDYNGTVAPPFTTFFGLYDHYYAFGKDTAWDLPGRWLQPPATFDRATPMNFVATLDITGGNSGSPILNRDLEVVGLAFDGNIESLSGDFIFLPEQSRAIAVDVRGILESLDDIYDADRLVLELTGGAFVPTENEADAILSSQD